MKQVLIVGDTHSDASFVGNIHRVAKASEETETPITTIVQLGDFGFSFDANVMASITSWLERDPDHKWYWVDGNHDQHDYLDALVNLAGWESPISMSRLPWPEWKGNKYQEFPERLLYCPRASTWTLGSTGCMALGGAYSIDKQYRKLGSTWWHQELITEADLRKVEQVMQDREESIDVMFTHDIPIVPAFEAALDEAGYKVGHESYANRLAMTHAVKMVMPQELYHGHYHHRHTKEHITDNGWSVRVEGIGANVAIPMRWAKPSQAIEDWNYVIRTF